MISTKKLIFPLTIALLASCGNGGGTPASSSSEQGTSSDATMEDSSVESSNHSSVDPFDGFEDRDVAIEFMSNSSYGDNIDAYITAFQELYPNVTVTNKKESADYQGVIDKVISGIPANNYPDIVVGYPDGIQQIMQANKVVKLDPFIDHETYGWTDGDKADIMEAYMEEGQSYPRSGTWSLPFAKSTEALFYNKDILVGLDLSDATTKISAEDCTITEDYLNDLTWEELFGKLCPAIIEHNDLIEDADKKILKDHATFSKAVFGYDSDDNLFITLAAQYGYGYTAIDDYGEGILEFVNPGMKGLMKTFNEAKNNGYFITKGTANEGKYTNYSFTAGAALFTVGSTGGLKYQVCDDFETGVAPLPHPEGMPRKLINQGPSLGILNHDSTDRALASWLFCKFITDPECALNWSVNTGYLPIRYSVAESADYRREIAQGKQEDVHSLGHLQAMVSEYIGNAEYVGDCLFASPVFKGSAVARTQVGSLTTIILNKPTAECTDEFIDAEFDKAYSNVLKEM